MQSARYPPIPFEAVASLFAVLSTISSRDVQLLQLTLPLLHVSIRNQHLASLGLLWRSFYPEEKA